MPISRENIQRITNASLTGAALVFFPESISQFSTANQIPQTSIASQIETPMYIRCIDAPTSDRDRNPHKSQPWEPGPPPKIIEPIDSNGQSIPPCHPRGEIMMQSLINGSEVTVYFNRST